MQRPPGNNNSDGKRPPGQKGPPRMPEPISEPHTIASQSTVRTLENSYHVTGCMGGMSTIYKASNRETGEDVAIKFLFKRSLRGMDEENKEAAMERFKREARLAVRIRHPNIMKTTDFGFHDNDPFIVMEYFPGENLHSIVKKAVDENGRSAITWEWLGPVVMQVCDGLHAAHAQHIMHRNIKPGNLMILTEDGEGPRENWEVLRPVIGVKVLDFGLAKYVYDQGTPEDLTSQGIIVGTWNYIAPEEIVNAQQGTAVDQRVDIYSLGVTIYRILTGSYPFPEEIEGLLKRLTDMPPTPSSLNPDITSEVDAIILKAMATKPEDRYQSAMDLRAAIADTL